MTLRTYSSVVELPFYRELENTEDDNKTILKTDQFFSAIGNVERWFKDDRFKKSEKLQLQKITDQIKSMLVEIDVERKERISEEYSRLYGEQCAKILSDIVQTSSDCKSKIVRDALDQLRITVNTLKAFFDNCFKAHFM